MRKSFLLKAMLAAAFPLFATEDETAGAAPSSTDAVQDQPASDAGADAAPVADTSAASDTPAAADTAAAPAVEPETPAASDASQAPADGAPVDTGEVAAPTAAPIVQTPTPVAQSGSAGDPVLETVKTPAHNVAAEIQEAIQKIEQLPAEVRAWFESKFSELSTHIKALL